MGRNTSLRAAHIPIHNYTLKIVWETSKPRSFGRDPRVVECSLVHAERSTSYSFDLSALAKEFGDLADAMRESIGKEPTDD